MASTRISTSKNFIRILTIHFFLTANIYTYLYWFFFFFFFFIFKTNICLETCNFYDNVVVVNMSSRNMVGIFTLKKSQILLKFFTNLVHIRSTINFLNEWKLLRCLSVMGYSWECGRLLLRICHNDFWFCEILKDRLVSKIFWRP